MVAPVVDQVNVPLVQKAAEPERPPLALIGAVAGGGKGAGIGAAVGAGLGTLGALVSKGNDVEVSSGTEVAMSLDREVTIPVSR